MNDFKFDAHRVFRHKKPGLSKSDYMSSFRGVFKLADLSNTTAIKTEKGFLPNSAIGTELTGKFDSTQISIGVNLSI